MIKFFLCKDKNWTVFLSGVLTNIPVSTLFCFKEYGKSCWDHIYFWVLIGIVVVSIPMLFCAFKFSIKVLAIKEDIESQYNADRMAYIARHEGDEFIETAIISPKQRIEEKFLSNDKDIKCLKFWGRIFVISLIVLLAAVIFIWVMNRWFIVQRDFSIEKSINRIFKSFVHFSGGDCCNYFNAVWR